jgi:hypothetical protein
MKHINAASNSSTLDLPISPPRKRSRSGHRHGITDAQRRELRQYWAKAPVDAKPTQNRITIWFSAKFHPISQSAVSDSLKPIYDYLDTEKSWNDLSALPAKMGTGQISRPLYSNGS